MACGDPDKTVDGTFIEYYYARVHELLVIDFYRSISEFIFEVKESVTGSPD